MFPCQSLLDRANVLILLLTTLLCSVVLFVCGCRREETGRVKSPADSSEVIAEASDRARGEADPLAAAMAQMQRGHPEKALHAVEEILGSQPKNIEALGAAVEIHSRHGEFAEAADYGVRLASADPRDAPALLIRCFDWNLRAGRYALAEANLLTSLEFAPRDVAARRLLVQLLNSQGRRIETRPHVEELIRGKAVAWPEILSLIDLRGPFTLVSFDEAIDVSKVSLFSLGKLRTSYAGFESKPAQVIESAERILEACPDSASAWAFYGRLLVENGRERDLPDWLSDLPPGTTAQPEYWTTLGTWLQRADRHAEAIRAYGEALRLDSGNREALRDLVVSLDRMGAEEQSLAARKQLAILDQIFRIARDADAEQSMWIATEMQKLTRPWEALAWMMHAAQISGNLGQLIPELDRRASIVAQWEAATSPELIATSRVAKLLGFELENYPLPNLDEITDVDATSIASMSPNSQSPDRDPSHAEDPRLIRFDDVASEVGIDVTTETGFFAQPDSYYSYQVDGSGIGVLDYDLDGRPDVYVMQSGGPPNDAQGSEPNVLFRQVPGQSFADVTLQAQTTDRNFGAGVAVGDVNQDGFPDLLLGNVGASVLFINQGDGSFRNASELLQENPATWTSSFAIADLSGDHLPELIQVNYIDDPTAFEVKCAGGYLLCQPQRFHPATDRVLKANADGTFATWKSITTIADQPKLGLGLVVANFDKQHGNDFFVSNDGDLNHYWNSVPSDDASEDRFTLVESAGLRGCSIGQGGTSQACMGIAAGDFNRDGLLDMYITNFYHEPVNLFVQNRLGFFTDQVTRFGLSEPSMSVLGFGTQSRDFDNDGWLDLATLNGHVFDASDQGVPFRMKAQLMTGDRRGFTLEQPDTAGAYWQREQLGRALATWDWNADGKMDLIANHLDQPVAVLQNNSETPNWLQLELVGTTSERDAIGADVILTSGSESWTAFRTAGDGYMVSNEPVLHFGIGDHIKLDRVVVNWPSGRAQTFNDVSANARYLLVEDVAEPYQRPAAK